MRHGLRLLPLGPYGQCLGGGGWILSHKVNGTQTEYVRPGEPEGPPQMRAQTETIGLAEAVRAAGSAPSIHNTQPWRWRVPKA